MEGGCIFFLNFMVLKRSHDEEECRGKMEGRKRKKGVKVPLWSLSKHLTNENHCISLSSISSNLDKPLRLRILACVLFDYSFISCFSF